MPDQQLVFEVAPDFCQVGLLTGEDFHLLESFHFEGKKDFQYKERLAVCLDKHQLKTIEVADVSVSWNASYSSLVPTTIFKPELAEDLLSLCFSKTFQKNDIDYNRLHGVAMVNVFEVPLWLKSFFVIRFPRVNIQHHYTHLISALEPFKREKHFVCCLVYPEATIILVTELGEIKFCNSFPIAQEEDVLYYLSFVLQQLQIEQGLLGITSSPLVTFTNENQLVEALKKIKLLQKFTVNIELHFNLKAQRFCV